MADFRTARESVLWRASRWALRYCNRMVWIVNCGRDVWLVANEGRASSDKMRMAPWAMPSTSPTVLKAGLVLDVDLGQSANVARHHGNTRRHSFRGAGKTLSQRSINRSEMSNGSIGLTLPRNTTSSESPSSDTAIRWPDPVRRPPSAAHILDSFEPAQNVVTSNTRLTGQRLLM